MGELICTEAITLNENGSWTDHHTGRDYKLKCLARYSVTRLFVEAVVYGAAAEGARHAILAVYLPARWIQFVAAGCHLAAWMFLVIAALAMAEVTARAFGYLYEEVIREVAPTRPSASSGAARLPATRAAAKLSNRPPAAAVFLLDLVLPMRERLTILGDLEEAYTGDLLPQHGRAKARLWYWLRAVREVVFCCWPAVKRLLPWTVLIAMAHNKSEWLAEVMRRLAQP